MAFGEPIKPLSLKEQRARNARRGALVDFLSGRPSASSTSLATSYGLSIENVRLVMSQLGVTDNG